MTRLDANIDKRILKAVKGGDRAAFAELYDRHGSWLLGVACRFLGNRRDAEDLLHDVFIEVWNKAASYDPERGAVSTWLGTRLRSRALDRLRSLSATRANEIEHFANQTNIHETVDDVSDSVDHLQARRLLDRLSPAQRMVIELSYFEGLTCREISMRCKLPVGTVKSRLSAAMGILRKEYNTAENIG